MRATRSVALAAVLAFAAFVTTSAAAPARRAILTGRDALVLSGVPAIARVKVERNGASRGDLRGVPVELWANGARLGTAVSRSDGIAELRVNVPAGSGDLVVTAKLAAGSPYSASDETLLLAVRDRTKRVVVTDIDGTVSAASWSDVVRKSNSALPPVRGAVRALKDLARDAAIVYLTAREDGYRQKTKDWLALFGLPRGPVYFSDDDAPSSSSTRAYKSGVMRSLTASFANIAAGFGNRAADAQAYHDHGVTSYLFDTQRGPYPSYAIVTRDWDDLRAANAAGRVPGLAWATSFR